MPSRRAVKSDSDDVSEKVSMQQSTFLLLKDMIKQGQIRPGEKLLEVQVAKAFGISRSPARLALRALCDAKIVSELDGRGYQIVGRPKPEHMGRVAKLQELRISPRRQWERVFEKVEHEIRVRVLFGSLRIIEAPLAEHFHVSRTVARDVLGRMQSIGLVSKHGGHWIAERVSTDRIRHLFEMRMILEPEAMRLAARFISKDELERAQATLRQILSGTQIEIEAIGRAETELHIDLLNHCPNREIVHALSRTHLLFVPSLYLLDSDLIVPQKTTETAFQEHKEIIEFLLDDKLKRATACLREHLQAAMSRWLDRFELLAKSRRPDLPSYLTDHEKAR